MKIKILFTAVVFLFFANSFAENSELSAENKADESDSQLSQANSDNDDSSSVANLHKRVLDLEEKVRELNGKVQYSDYTYKKIIEKINNLASDVNYRFSELVEEKGAENKEITTPTDKIAHYSSMIEEKNYKDAIAGLMKFIKINHNKIDLDEPYYLLGTAYMEQSLYDKAGTYFLKCYKYYPKKPRAPESLLGLAKSLAKLEKYNRACSILSRLEKEYPNRTEEEKSLSIAEKKNIKCSN